MTTTAFDDQFTVGTQPLEPVREPMSREAILRRNIADMEVALRTQTELKERAEAELAKLAQQEPIKYLYRVIDCFGHDVLRDDPRDATIIETIPLYAAPVPAPHKGATHCDDCGLTWLDDGLNPLGCPYCKDTVPAPDVPNDIIPKGDDFNGTTPHLIQCIESLVRLDAKGVLVPHGIGRDASKLLTAAANRLRQQAPAVPAEWREVMAELAADLQAAYDAEHPHRDQYRRGRRGVFPA